MNQRAFTLLELLITLTIICITLTFGIPSFSEQIKESRTKTVTYSLLEAIETARSTAVFQNKRTVLIATDRKWHKGWEFFVDLNNDGKLNGSEVLAGKVGKREGVIIKTTDQDPLKESISFIGTGEGRKPGNANSGAFLSGTIRVCPETEGAGYALILSKGGRTRVKKLSAAECQ